MYSIGDAGRQDVGRKKKVRCGRGGQISLKGMNYTVRLGRGKPLDRQARLDRVGTTNVRVEQGTLPTWDAADMQKGGQKSAVASPVSASSVPSLLSYFSRRQFPTNPTILLFCCTAVLLYYCTKLLSCYPILTIPLYAAINTSRGPSRRENHDCKSISSLSSHPVSLLKISPPHYFVCSRRAASNLPKYINSDPA
jgi:hypothetical protein